jgi:hypothetical protein
VSPPQSTALFVKSLLLVQKPPIVHPDGRALYGYRVEEHRYQTLQERVRNEFAALRAGSASPEAAAGFVLYAAETWRRSEDVTRWNSWKCVFDGLGVEEVPLTELYPAVRDGLRYWKRSLRRFGGRNRYVATLVCEGGLPLHLLRTDGSRFRRYFRKLLADVRDFGLDVDRLARTAEAAADDLPASLRLEQIYGLATDLVAEIWRAHERLVGNPADPIATLDHLDPSWRDRLPLKLDDAIAHDLLHNLLRDVDEVAKDRSAVPRVLRWLEEHEDGWRLRARMETPNQTTAAKFTELLTGGTKELPKHARLALATGTTTNQPFGTLYRNGEVQVAVERSAPHRAEVSDAAAARSLQLVIDAAATRAAETLTVQVPRGHELSASQPWVFGAKNATTGHARLLADGSCRTKQDEVLVALPIGVRAAVAPGGEWRSLGSLRELAREVFVCRGQLLLTDDDGDTWRVATAQPVDEELEFWLCGGRYAIGTSPNLDVFAGPPRVLARNSAGDATAMPKHEVVWRPAVRGAAWRSGEAAALGVVDVRVLVDGATCLHRRIAVVPKSFACSIMPESEARGRVDWRGLDGATIRVQPTQGTSVVPAPNAARDQLSLVCETTGAAPTTLIAQIGWPGAQPIEATVAAPFRSAHFVTDDGVKLTNELVEFDELYQLRVQVVTGERGVRYDVIGELRNPRVDVGEANRKIAIDFPLREVEPGRHEADLRRLVEPMRRALRTAPDLDTHLLLRVERNDIQLPQPRLEVHRYAGNLKFEKSEGWVEYGAASRPTRDDPSARRVHAMPLWLPMQQETTLEPAPTPSPRWLFDPTSRAPGPWLLYGSHRGTPCTRTVLWTVPGEPATSASNAHQRAVLAQPDAQPAARRELYAALVDGSDEAAWMDLSALLARTANLPAASFMTLLHLPEHPPALVACMLGAKQDQRHLVFDLRNELPFEWSMLPLAAWTAGVASWIERRRRQYESHGIPATETPEFLTLDAQALLNRLPSTDQALSTVLRTTLHHLLPGITEPELVTQLRHPRTRPMRAASVEGRWQEARRRLAEVPREQWPKSQDINEWAKSHPDSALHLPCFVDGDDLEQYRSIARAPWIAACASAAGVQMTAMLTMQLLQARAFDPEWFDAAHTFYLAVALADSPLFQASNP